MRYIKGSRDPERKEEGGTKGNGGGGGECAREIGDVPCTAAFIAKGNLHFRRVGKSVKSFSSIPMVNCLRIFAI